jgi:hypothetical protein
VAPAPTKGASAASTAAAAAGETELAWQGKGKGKGSGGKQQPKKSPAQKAGAKPLQLPAAVPGPAIQSGVGTPLAMEDLEEQ